MAGWKLRADVHTADDGAVCVECAAAGRVTFTCWLCGEERPTAQLERAIGDPSDFLCRPCYETVPASRWDKAVAELQNQHRWDFE